MKRILFSLILLVSLQGWSQVDTLKFTTRRDIADKVFGLLSPNLYQGILLERSASENQMMINQTKGNYNQIHSAFSWLEFHSDLSVSYVDSNYMLNDKELLNTLEEKAKKYQDTLRSENIYQPFGLLLHNATHIDSNLLNHNIFSNQNNQLFLNANIDEQNIYRKCLIKSAGLLEIYSDHGFDVGHIIYEPEFIKTSPDISLTSIRINVGNGYVDFNLSQNKISYSAKTDSTIARVAIEYLKNEIVHYDTIEFYLTTNVYKYKDNSKSSKRWDSDTEFYVDVSSFMIFQLGIKYGCGNRDKIRRPVIIAPPYRPSMQFFSMNKYYDQFDFASLLSSLTDMGYDVIFLKEWPGNPGSERAGLGLANFIQYINGLKKQNYPDEDWENIAIGFSMGGQHWRYALKYMEKRHMDLGLPHHHTRLYLPFDSPHWGANVPIFSQAVFYDLKNTNVFAALTYLSLVDDASKDMLMSHIKANDFDTPNDDYSYEPQPSNEFISHVNKLNNNFNHFYSHPNDLRKTFPSFTRNIAVSTGNNDEDYQFEYTFNPGMQLFSQNTVVPMLGGIAIKKRELNSSWYTISSTAFYKNDIRMYLLLIPVIDKRRYTTKYAYEWDMAQGGYKDEFYDGTVHENIPLPIGAVPILRSGTFGIGQKHYNKHVNFLPMVSALGINPTIWANNNLFYNLKDKGLMFNEFNFDPNIPSEIFGYPHLAHPTNHYNITPFEAVFCDPQTYEHIKMQKSVEEDELNGTYLVNTRNFILDEVEADVVGLQNKIIGKNHNPNLPNYKYRAWYKAYEGIEIGCQVTPKTNPGDFIIEATGDITVHAGQTISIKPGFHAQYGSDFHAYIDYECSRPREGKSAASDSDSSSEEGENNTSKHNRKTENTFASLENKPKIYPNPNAGSFVVEIPDDQLGGNYSITDINGKILEQGIFTDSTKKSFYLPKGFYYFHFNGNINVQKIVVL